MQAEARVRSDKRAQPAGLRPARFLARIDAEPLAVRMLLYALLNRFSRELGREDAGTIELVLAEVLNNIVEHAYAGRPAGAIEVAASIENKRFFCAIRDWGVAVPGDLLLPGPDLAVLDDVGGLPEGGWGWSLIRGLTEALRYARSADMNELVFEIALGGR